MTIVAAVAVKDVACFRTDVRNLSSDRTVSVAADAVGAVAT